MSGMPGVEGGGGTSDRYPERPSGDGAGGPARREPRWGLGDAAAGFLVGFLVASLAVAVWAAAANVPRNAGAAEQTFGVVVAGLLGLWVGLAGSPVLASRLKGSGRLSIDFGLSIRPLTDVPIGVAVGLASQLLLVPVLYLPLHPFVRDLDQRLGQPARQLTGSSTGAGFVVIAVLVCVGAPLVEELYFRGLLLRSLDKRLASLGRVAAPVLSVAVSAVAFGLAHAQSLQLLGLVALGVVLGAMAERFGRLGPGIVAHATFNTVAVVSIALSR